MTAGLEAARSVDEHKVRRLGKVNPNKEEAQCLQYSEVPTKRSSIMLSLTKAG